MILSKISRRNISKIYHNNVSNEYRNIYSIIEHNIKKSFSSSNNQNNRNERSNDKHEDYEILDDEQIYQKSIFKNKSFTQRHKLNLGMFATGLLGFYFGTFTIKIYETN